MAKKSAYGRTEVVSVTYPGASEGSSFTESLMSDGTVLVNQQFVMSDTGEKVNCGWKVEPLSTKLVGRHGTEGWLALMTRAHSGAVVKRTAPRGWDRIEAGKEVTA